MRIRFVDLFCGPGGAAVGYHRAARALGIDLDIVGVDTKPQPDFPFEFVQADALTFSLDGFVAAHASPPCQTFTRAGHLRDAQGKKTSAVNLIAPTRDRLIASGVPYIIENVEPARPFMRDPLMLCGSTFGLKVRRHRLFESNVMMLGAGPCLHREQGRPVGVYYALGDDIPQGGRTAPTLAAGLEAMGVDHITRWSTTKTKGTGLVEAIPPAFTEHLGRQLLALIERKG